MIWDFQEQIPSINHTLTLHSQFVLHLSFRAHSSRFSDVEVEASTAARSTNGGPVAAPRTVVLDGHRLAEAKKLLAGGDPEIQNALEYLTAQADSWLEQGPWSVTSKNITPPSGDKHDYASQAIYWWPSDSPDGLPYIQKDGEANPEIKKYEDRGALSKLFGSSLILSLAWHYTGNPAYAIHAGNILRTWFIAPETRMNPHLKHAQIIPGRNTGRYIGIIDFSQGYTSVLDGAAILAAGAPGWRENDSDGFRQWNVEFLEWLTTSDFGIAESAAANNHGTFAMMQKAAMALFLDDEEVARRELLLIRSRIDEDIEPDGSQPKELDRTRSWHYSNFNLVAYLRAAAIGKKVGVDFWGYKGPRGQSLPRAVEFVIPAATSEKAWGFPEKGFKAYAASDAIHCAGDEGNLASKAALSKLQCPPDGDLWVLRPAVEQLDPVKST